MLGCTSYNDDLMMIRRAGDSIFLDRLLLAVKVVVNNVLTVSQVNFDTGRTNNNCLLVATRLDENSLADGIVIISISSKSKWKYERSEKTSVTKDDIFGGQDDVSSLKDEFLSFSIRQHIIHDD